MGELSEGMNPTPLGPSLWFISSGQTVTRKDKAQEAGVVPPGDCWRRGGSSSYKRRHPGLVLPWG